MSANSRKAKRRRNRVSEIDYAAEQEGQAMAGGFSSRTIDFGKRMNKYYYCDGERFNTGKKHRRSATGMSAVERKPKVRKRRASKHIDLRSLAVHKRIENPELYKTLDIRLVQHLVEYKAGIVRPISTNII